MFVTERKDGIEVLLRFQSGYGDQELTERGGGAPKDGGPCLLNLIVCTPKDTPCVTHSFFHLPFPSPQIRLSLLSWERWSHFEVPLGKSLSGLWRCEPFVQITWHHRQCQIIYLGIHPPETATACELKWLRFQWQH